MKKTDIIKFFPKKCIITLDIIENNKSIGTYLLKSFLPEEFWEDTFWGLSIGNIGPVKIKTEITIDKIQYPLYLDKNIEPQEIEFTLR